MAWLEGVRTQKDGIILNRDKEGGGWVGVKKEIVSLLQFFHLKGTLTSFLN